VRRVNPRPSGDDDRRSRSARRPLGRRLLARVHAAERRRYPSLERIGAALGTDDLEVRVLTIPFDCSDGFITDSFYGRPEAMLESAVRRAQSAWSFVDAAARPVSPESLSADLAFRRLGRAPRPPPHPAELAGSMRIPGRLARRLMPRRGTVDRPRVPGLGGAGDGCGAGAGEAVARAGRWATPAGCGGPSTGGAPGGSRKAPRGSRECAGGVRRGAQGSRGSAPGESRKALRGVAGVRRGSQGRRSRESRECAGVSQGRRSRESRGAPGSHERRERVTEGARSHEGLRLDPAILPRCAKPLP